MGMKLLSLRLHQFRNLKEVELLPSSHATVVVGPNGQGKTNLLEGLYFLATLKPLRAQRLSELVAFGAEAAWVSGRFELHGAEREISVEVSSKGTRQAKVDGKKAASFEDYFGGVAVVAFTPDDLQVVKGGPDGRRAFLDRAVFNRFPAYLKESREYSRALKARNTLLKERVSQDYLQAFDETLAKAGARIWVRRRALMAEVAPQAQKAFEAIGRAPVEALYGYHPAKVKMDFDAADEESLRHGLRQALDERRARDWERGFTSVGPHADDVRIELGEHTAKAFASQGQQRALVLAWKIAEIENLARSLGYLPLLLLDDVSSELDPERNAFLMQYLAQSGAQVFLSTTEPSLVQKAAQPDTSWYTVQAGVVQPRRLS